MIDYNLLALQNPWWEDPAAIGRDIQIDAFERAAWKFLPAQVLDMKLRPGALNILTGPRQTGKSTAIKLLVRKLLAGRKEDPRAIVYFNCDALAGKKELIDLLVQVTGRRTAGGYLFLDEITSVSDWPFGVKWAADAGLLRGWKMLLAGSSSINLRKSGEYLPGRRNGGKDLLLMPLGFAEHLGMVEPDAGVTMASSFEELEETDRRLTRKKIDLGTRYLRFCATGGFLRAINAEAGGETALGGALDLYVAGLRSELARSGRKEASARKVLAKIVSSLSSETSYASVAEEAELGSKNTAAEYLAFFSDSFFLKETLNYSIERRSASLKKNKKYYPTDPFFLWVFKSFVSGSSSFGLLSRPYFEDALLASRLAEGFVASELFKRGIDYYFSRSTRELDFFIPAAECGIEVKHKAKITGDDCKPLDPAPRKIMVSGGTLERRGDILVVPAHLFPLLDVIEYCRRAAR